MLSFVLLWLCQLSSESEASEGLTRLGTRWYGPSYQPSWWTSSSVSVSLRRSGFSYEGPEAFYGVLVKFCEKMGEKGCFSHVFGGAIKGLIMGGLLGGMVGIALRQNVTGVAIMASQGAQVLGVAKLLVGPEVWSHRYPDCEGNQQSPINIQTGDLKKRKTKRPLRWSNYSKMPWRMVEQNSLHSIHIKGLWKNSSDVPFITHGPLEKQYYFSQLHFHWGKVDILGSEHTVNRKSFPVEMHVVHDRLIEQPANMSQESEADDNLVVVSYMFEIVRYDNPALTPILNGLRDVKGNEQKKTYIKPFPLDDLVEPFHGDYVTYKGSLTTPPCTEGVIWIINSKPLGISDGQLEILRNSITDAYGDTVRNYRPTQRLNKRNVYYIHC